MFQAEGGQVVISNLLLQRDSLAVESQRLVGEANGELEFGPARGLVGQIALQLLHRVAQSVRYGNGAAVARRVGTLEYFGQEFGDGFGFGQALFGQGRARVARTACQTLMPVAATSTTAISAATAKAALWRRTVF